MLFKLDFFFIMSSTFVLSTQIENEDDIFIKSYAR